MSTETETSRKNGAATALRRPWFRRNGAAGSRTREDEFTSEHHVYEPHAAGLPPLRSYVRELWRRREFAFELSRTRLRAQHFDTTFGQLWLILNPLLLGAVYFLLTTILHKHKHPQFFFAHLMAGLFLYYFLQQALTQSVKSVTS